MSNAKKQTHGNHERRSAHLAKFRYYSRLLNLDPATIDALTAEINAQQIGAADKRDGDED